MPNYKVSFMAMVTAEFHNCTIATDGDLTIIVKDGTRAFGIPTKNLVAFDTIPNVAPAPEPEPQPVPA